MSSWVSIYLCCLLHSWDPQPGRWCGGHLLWRPAVGSRARWSSKSPTRAPEPRPPSRGCSPELRWWYLSPVEGGRKGAIKAVPPLPCDGFELVVTASTREMQPGIQTRAQSVMFNGGDTSPLRKLWCGTQRHVAQLKSRMSGNRKMLYKFVFLL